MRTETCKTESSRVPDPHCNTRTQKVFKDTSWTVEQQSFVERNKRMTRPSLEVWCQYRGQSQDYVKPRTDPVG